MEQEQIDKALLRLYAQAQEVPVEAFIGLTVKCLDRFIPFDSAIFAEGKRLSTGARVPTSAYLHNQPIEKWSHYQEVAHLDLTIDAAISNLGAAVSFPSEQLPKSRRFSPLREYVEKWEVKHTLVTLLASPTKSNNDELNVSIVSLWRAYENKAYSTHEQRLCTEILPHLTRARILNKHHFLSSVKSSRLSSTVVCTNEGRIICVDDEAADLLCKEWPQWFPPLLPACFMEVLGRHRDMIYQGEALEAKARKLGSHIVITLRPTPTIAKLTPAESAVAKLISAPMSYKEVAVHLGVSTSTVRNQLHSIYEKLHMKNKAELALFMATLLGKDH